MLHINIVFWTEALDGISIVYDTDRIVPHASPSNIFSGLIVIRCPACRFRLKDIHEMSPIVWVWYRLRNSFCLWFQPSIVRTPRTEIGSLLFARMHHDRFDLSEVSCTREFQFVTSWFTPLSIKMSRIEKEQFIRRLTHFTLNVVFTNRGVINPLGNLTAYVYKAFFSICFVSYPLYNGSDILLISSSERSSNLLYFSHSRVAPSARASRTAAFVRSASP